MVGYLKDGEHHEISKFWQGVAGVVSGTITRFLCQPLDVLKIRFQLQHEPLQPKKGNYYWSMHQAIFRIYKEESFRALWKGHVPAQLLSGVYGLVQFGTFESLTKLASNGSPTTGYVSSPVTNFLCGAASGAVATVVSMPCDTLRTRLVGQGEPKLYHGVLHACRTMVKEEGVLSLYKGLVPGVLQIMPHTGIQFASFILLSDIYWLITRQRKSRKLPLLGNLVCGSLAGLLAKIAMYPLDLSKKRLQVQGFENARVHFGKVRIYSGLMNCLIATLREEGLRGLYKGLAPSLLKAMLTTALTFTIYEETSAIFSELKL